MKDLKKKEEKYFMELEKTNSGIIIKVSYTGILLILALIILFVSC